MPADGFAPVLKEHMVLVPGVQDIRGDARSPDGFVPSAEMLECVVNGGAGPGIEFFLRWSTAKFFGECDDGVCNFAFAGHEKNQSRNRDSARHRDFTSGSTDDS